MREQMLDAYADVRASLKKAAETQRKYYNLRIKPTALAKGVTRPRVHA